MADRGTARPERMTVARLAAAGGVGVETVRYYQRRGLMPVPDGAGGIRRYDAGDAARLRFVRAAQGAGFTLAEIAELLRLDAVDDRARAREMAVARLAALDARVAELLTARAALARLAEECGRSDKGPCPIIRAFESGSATDDPRKDAPA